MTRFVIRIDDANPAMSWPRFERLARSIEIAGVAPIVGVVPDCRDASLACDSPRVDFWDLVRSWRSKGWTIAQHGYRHVYDSQDAGILAVKSQSEFAGHSLPEQTHRLEQGKNIMMQQGVWQPIFMAPGHSFDLKTLSALKSTGFRCLTDGYGLYPYTYDSLVFVPQLFSTPRNTGLGIYTVCLHPNKMSDAQIGMACDFVESERHRIISFPDAVRAGLGPPFVGRISRNLLRRTIPRIRRLRGTSIA